MPKRMTLFVPAILVILLAAVSLTARSGFAQGAADECVAKPGSAAPEGSHWYYRVNRTDRRHCWYLGPEGAKVHARVRQAGSPRLLSPPAAKLPAEVTAAQPAPAQSAATQSAADEAAPAAIAGGESNAPAEFAMRWPDLPKSPGSIARAPTSMSNSYAEEQTATDQDDMPLIWPVLTPAELAAAGPPLQSAFKPEFMLAIIAGALAFAAMIVRSIFKLCAVGQPSRSDLRGERRAAPNVPRRRKPAPLPGADTTAAARQAVAMRKSVAATRHDGIARQPLKPGEASMDPGPDIEEGLRRLTHDWRPAAA